MISKIEGGGGYPDFQLMYDPSQAQPERAPPTLFWSEIHSDVPFRRAAAQALSRPDAGSPLSIQRLLPFRARLPSSMHPQPLLRILPDILFDDGRELLRVGLNVGLKMA